MPVLDAPYSPVSGEEVKRHQVEDVIDYIDSKEEGTRFLIVAPVTYSDRTAIQHLTILASQGFARMMVDGAIERIEDVIEAGAYDEKTIMLVVDRAVVRKDDQENIHRLQDSIQTAFYEGRGSCLIDFMNGEQPVEFNNLFELDGMAFTEPSIHLFSFNNPVGACPTCEGFGSIMGVDEDLVIPNQTLSVYEGAVAPGRARLWVNGKPNLFWALAKLAFLCTARTWTSVTKNEKFYGKEEKVSKESMPSSNISKARNTRSNSE